ncbi:hypothetical protein TRAPUB_505 [Trametes pubescens]|uniref:Uncharacterized protein n=1 Tax=Trametes pubescens TaxID=154538 RepID=A0A1M2VLY0_TRAPU|nr:hypothetical protein TRAPUB_505 [Trametes pubescens]
MNQAQLSHWLTTTDAKLTFIGPPPNSNPLAPRSAEDTVVTYCSKRIGSCCGGECTVYNGGAACIDTPHTECMAATKDVGYCDRKGCNGNCNDLAACGTKLRDGFCYTYGTKSIVTSIL